MLFINNNLSTREKKGKIPPHSAFPQESPDKYIQMWSSSVAQVIINIYHYSQTKITMHTTHARNESFLNESFDFVVGFVLNWSKLAVRDESIHLWTHMCGWFYMNFISIGEKHVFGSVLHICHALYQTLLLSVTNLFVEKRLTRT